LKNNTPIFDGKIIKKGKTITINDIYYDYNKYDIRSEATPGLDRLAEVMLKYPTIELELSSHTDCRGKAESNEKLSQQRAEEATKYLISKGVAARRMIARGYGESKPVNTCVDGVTCSEEEHQKNRRTEIKILRFETEDLEVIKGDN
jgi:outer membrane protein OmpA-like peptidoglycan-associated protein